jgi:RND superfamily putative drug exporter
MRTVTSFSVRRPVLVIVVWLAVVGAGFGTGIGVFDRLISDVGTVPGSESDRAAERLRNAGPPPEIVTAVAPAGIAELSPAIVDVRGIPGVADVSEPLLSADGQAALVQVTLRPEGDEMKAAEAAAARLRQVPGTVVSGGPLMEAEFNDQAQSDVQRAETLTMPLVLLLLLVIFGGLLAAGLPLLIAVLGIGSAFGIVYAFSFATDISVYSIQVITMLSVGLAVDYALLIVSRFREERAANPDVRVALARTTASAGRTVMFSGLTVAVALAGLLVFPDPFLRSMGLAGAAAVVVDMLAALTLLPALLALFGRRIKPAKPRPANGGVFARVARAVQRRPLVTIAVTAAGMVTLALPVLDLGLSQGDARMLPTSTNTRQLYDAMAAHFPERNGPDEITVVAQTSPDSAEFAAYRDRVAAVPGVSTVDIDRTRPGLAVLEATPTAGPATAESRETVAAIRAIPAPFDVSVTGQAAQLVDYRAMLAERLPWGIAIVALATLVLLFLFTGSVLLPIKAVLTSMLSIGAALGVVVWVFQQGHFASWFDSVGLGYTHLTVPVLVGAIAFGLSVDYEVFLLSRMRERWLAGLPANRAVAEGLQRTGVIVTSAALLMVVVFSGFLFGGFAPIKEIGLGLVLAIALDATIVRMLLVPATMTVLGRYNWWAPRPLRRLHARVALREAPTPAPEPVPVG